MLTTQMRLYVNQMHGNPSADKWTLSPVCSRLTEHITLLNGKSYKERLFLQSPMTNGFGWPMTSPAVDISRSAHFASTAPNTSTNSKYANRTPLEGYSDAKAIMESPHLIRQFMEHDPI